MKAKLMWKGKCRHDKQKLCVWVKPELYCSAVTISLGPNRAPSSLQVSYKMQITLY